MGHQGRPVGNIVRGAGRGGWRRRRALGGAGHAGGPLEDGRRPVRHRSQRLSRPERRVLRRRRRHFRRDGPLLRRRRRHDVRLHRLPPRVRRLPRPPAPRAQALLVPVELGEAVEGGEETGDGGYRAVEAADGPVLGDERRLARPAVQMDPAERRLQIRERRRQVRRPRLQVRPQGEPGRRGERPPGTAQAADDAARLETQLLRTARGAAAEPEEAHRAPGAVDALARGPDGDQAPVQLPGGTVAPLPRVEAVPLLLQVRVIRRLERPPRVVDQQPERLLQPADAEAPAARRRPRQQRLEPRRRLAGVLPRRRRQRPGLPLPPRHRHGRHRSPPFLIGRGGPGAAGRGRPTSARPPAGATGRGAGESGGQDEEGGFGDRRWQYFSIGRCRASERVRASRTRGLRRAPGGDTAGVRRGGRRGVARSRGRPGRRRAGRPRRVRRLASGGGERAAGRRTKGRARR